MRQRPGRLAPSPVRNENPAAAGLTPMRLGAFEPVRQRGAGAYGTVDCCHERESQTRNWKAPPDGTSRHRDNGATHSHLTTERFPRLGQRLGQFSHVRSRACRPRDSQASLRAKHHPVTAVGERAWQAKAAARWRPVIRVKVRA